MTLVTALVLPMALCFTSWKEASAFSAVSLASHLHNQRINGRRLHAECSNGRGSVPICYRQTCHRMASVTKSLGHDARLSMTTRLYCDDGGSDSGSSSDSGSGSSSDSGSSTNSDTGSDSNSSSSDTSTTTSTSSSSDATIGANVKFSRSSDQASTIQIRGSESDAATPAATTGSDDESTSTAARTTANAGNTINERLLQEIQRSEEEEKTGRKSKLSKKLSLTDGFGRPRKTDAEVQAAIEEARNLNGVNPWVALGGSLFAFVGSALLWYATQRLGYFFAMHPTIESDAYFVVRVTQVVRNASMGLISLASGFFGVVGLGIFLLGVRVLYGVTTGELDPTPLPSKLKKKDEVTEGLDNVWDLMLNKKPNRRNRKK